MDQPSFDGIFNSDDLNQLYNLQWTQLDNKNWLFKTSLTLNNFRKNSSLGVLVFEQKDQTDKLRLDSEREFQSRVKDLSRIYPLRTPADCKKCLGRRHGTFFPMFFLSGAAIPREVMPETIQNYAQIFPLTHVVNLLRGLWIGNGWAEHLKEMAVLSGMLVFGLAISAKTFRWE